MPGWINLYRDGNVERFKVTDPFKAKTLLNEQEMAQAVKPFNGDYDPEYLKINIIIRTINLKEIDAKFITEFSDYNQADMLKELKSYGEGNIEFSDISFSHHLTELLSKALCSEKSPWLPKRECR